MVVFPEGRSTFVGRHKSLNYLFYLAARQYALDRGAKEALILEADGLVSEGAATSLVYLHQGRYYTPASASALPGVTVTVLGRGLAARGLTLKTRPTTVAQLQEAHGLWLANSLMGLMPVASVNGTPMPLSPATAFLQEVLAGMIEGRTRGALRKCPCPPLRPFPTPVSVCRGDPGVRLSRADTQVRPYRWKSRLRPGSPKRTLLTSLKSSLHLLQDPAELFPGFFQVAGFIALLGKEFEAVGVVARDDVEMGVEHHLSRGLEIIHADIEPLGG